MTRLSGLRRPVLGTLTAAGEGEGEVVRVPMTAADRRRVRRRLRAPDGAELRLAFPTGTVLTPGTQLEVRGGVRYVVEAAPEDVAVVTPRTLAEAAALGHAVGNLHRDLVPDGAAFLALWDAPLELLLTRLGVPFTRDMRAFHGRPSWEHGE
ncbi:urease accessory protein UreE [Deinococcus arenae]|uniref:Urease accessory protein UreE n=1 Tax=Deinococcus arenae TaxID=1452751 RepID=A0A8H9L5U8_9DEIO|nr:urease accessory protein UreE [Deinococcus arenae]AWT37775.1 urease accessory protein UreE [Deinococcus actinosclerus]GGM38691.1 urease accessory protein UreE [Deinococcus arenae]